MGAFVPTESAMMTALCCQERRALDANLMMAEGGKDGRRTMGDVEGSEAWADDPPLAKTRADGTADDGTDRDWNCGSSKRETRVEMASCTDEGPEVSWLQEMDCVGKRERPRFEGQV